MWDREVKSEIKQWHLILIHSSTKKDCHLILIYSFINALLLLVAL